MMINAIELARAAKNEDEAQKEKEKTKPFIYKVFREIWNFVTCNRSLFIFSEENFVRRFACRFIAWGPFEWTILTTILCTTVVLALEEHLPNGDKTPLSISLESTENYFLGIFCTESFFKILAAGLILHKGAYLHNLWNIMDFLVVSTGLLTIFISSEGIGFDLKIIRAFRVLRPLKLVNGVPSLQVVLSSILKAMAPLMNIALLVFFCIVIFAIIGLEFYSGIFHATCFNITSMEKFIVPGEGQLRPCNTIGGGGSFTCSNEHFPPNPEIECIEGKWEGPNYGITCFDNIGFAMLTVFQCITMEGWTTMMYYTNDSQGNRYNVIYFVPLIILGSFFMLNLVLGVLSGEFAKERVKVEGRAAFLKMRIQKQMDTELTNYVDWIFTAEQAILSEQKTTELERRHIMDTRRNYEMKKMKMTNKGMSADDDDDNDLDDIDGAFAPKVNGKRVPRVDPNDKKPSKSIIWRRRERKLRFAIRKMIKTQIFYWTVIILVFLNALCAAVEHYNQPAWLSNFLVYTEITFLCTFIVEMLIKMYGLGKHLYLRSSFNKFDCVVIFGSVFELILTQINPEQSYGISILRSLRLLRVFKVTKYWVSLRNLVVSLIDSMKSIISLLFLLFLFVLIFALLGMQLFGGEMNFQENTPAQNFNRFPIAMLTVFQILTGEDWNEVMYNGIRSKGGPYSIGAIYCAYFVILVLFGNYTLLNVFLAIAVDNLANAQEMTARQEEEERLAREQKERCLNNEVTKFTNKLQGENGQGGDGTTGHDGKAGDGKEGPKKNEKHKTKEQKKREKEREEKKQLAKMKAAQAAAEAEAAATQIRVQKKPNDDDLEKMFNTHSKVAIDFIPGLDDEYKPVIMPGAFEAALKEGIEKKKRKEREKLEEAGGFVEEAPTKDKQDTTKDKTTQDTTANKKLNEDKTKINEEVKIPAPVVPPPVVAPLPPPPPPPPPAIRMPEPVEEPIGKPMVEHSCCFILYPDNCIREAVHAIVTYKYFDLFIMLVISASSIALATEDPVDENSERNKILNYFDYGFTAVFTVEMTLKMIDLGMICHEGSYFRDIWNVLDFVVVSCAIFSFAFSGSDAAAKNLSTMKSLRVLRVLRPLKTINRVPKLKAVFDCVINSLKNVFNIIIVYMLFMFIFAVIAVQLFKGRFFYCTDLSKKTKSECQGQYYSYDKSNLPSIENRRWLRWEFHYDNVIFAFLTLFTIQTGEGWPQILEHSMDITKVDQGPSPTNRMDMSFFYIVYFVVFPFFFVNIFVALIIITFQEQGEQELAEAEVNKNQKSCMEFALNSKPLELYVPPVKHGVSYRTWQLVNSSGFENFILMLITLNTIILMMKWHNQSHEVKHILKFVNIIFTTLFTAETVLKIIAYGPKAFLADFWNIFDLVTVIGSIVDAIVSEFIDKEEIINTGGGVTSPYAYAFTDSVSKKAKLNIGFLRLFRATRLIKLLRQSATIRILLWTFIQSIKALPYVCLLIAMLFFLYAIVGMQIFGNIKLSSETFLNRHNNFQNFGQAVILLFRCATGESWQEIMRSCLAGAECELKESEKLTMLAVPTDPKQKNSLMFTPKSNKKCGMDMAYAYFVSFVFLSSFLMLNLFVAVIMDNFDYLTRDASILGAHHLGEYITAWAEIDPAGKGRAHHADVLKMLLKMEPPVGFGNKCPKPLAYKRLIRMNMPVDENNTVHFTTTLFALIRESLKIKLLSMDDADEAQMDQADEELRHIVMKLWPFLDHKQVKLALPHRDELHGRPNCRVMTVGKIYAGLLMVENYRTYKASLAKYGENRPRQSSFFNRLMGVVRHHKSTSSINDEECKKYGLTRADSKLRIPTTASFKSKASFKSRASIRTRTCDTSPTTSILNKPLANGDLPINQNEYIMEQDETHFNFRRSFKNTVNSSTPNYNSNNIITTTTTNKIPTTGEYGSYNQQFQIDFNNNFNKVIHNNIQKQNQKNNNNNNNNYLNSNTGSPNFSIEMKSSSSRSTTPTPSQITDNRFIRNNNNQIIRNQQSGSRSPSPVLNFKPAGASINFNKQNGQINIINNDKNGGGYINEGYQKPASNRSSQRKMLPQPPSVPGSARKMPQPPSVNNRPTSNRSLPQPQANLNQTNRVLSGERVKLLPLQAGNVNSENENWF